MTYEFQPPDLDRLGQSAAWSGNSWLKAELHCHLDGLVDPAMLEQLAANGVRLPLDAATLAAAYPVNGYADFWRWIDVAEALEGALDNFRPIVAVHVERLKAQQVVYAELMVGTSEIPLDPTAAIDQFAAFRAWLADRAAGQIQVEFIPVFNRTHSAERLATRVPGLKRLHAAGQIVGVAIAGPEAGYPVEPFNQSLADLHAAGIPIEVHAGEWAGPESVADALAHGYPSRIGHAVAAFADPRLLDAIQARQIHLEFCPTANLRFGAISRIEDHPIRQALERGLSFSVNTDDPGASRQSLSDEYQLLADQFGFTDADFARLFEQTMAARWGSSTPTTQRDRG